MLRLPVRAIYVRVSVGVLVCLVGAACTESRASIDYRYTKSDAVWLVTDDSHRYGVLVPRTREIWIGTDGSGRLREDRGEPAYFSDKSRAEWQGVNPLPGDVDDAFTPGELSMVDTMGLSTDPALLRDQLLAGKGDTERDAQVILANALAYLRETVPPPALARAIVDVVRETGGIDATPGIKDATGRVGDAFSVNVGGGDPLRYTPTSRLLMIVDPVTGTLFEEQRILVDPNPLIDADPPAIFGRATYLASGITNSTSVRP